MLFWMTDDSFGRQLTLWMTGDILDDIVDEGLRFG